MPPDSTDRFLIAPVRAVRSSRKHLYLVFYQEPVRRPPGLLGPLKVPEALGLLGLSEPSEPLRPLV